ncbi:MAG TPA: HAD family hydrolase [Ruminiclostridium sp.]|nr:HAD family hydrolase [Ruminiclostridium sp.]
MNADALIFDMDGTLWDSSETVAASWNDVLAGYEEIKEPVTAQTLKSLMGKHLLQIGRELFPDMDEEKRDKMMHECCDHENEVLKQRGGILFDGLEETLKNLQAHTKLYIVSNCQRGYIESFFEYHKLGNYFNDFECAGMSGKNKGDNIIEIINRNKMKSAYYVGDTQIDYEATRKACIPFIYASYGFGDVSNYEYKINSITDLSTMFND